MDPVPLNTSSVDQLAKSPESALLPKGMNHATTSHVNEVWASTKAHPGWWTELEENKLQRRRKSIGGTVLERNICFVDTPGYGEGLSITEGIQAVVSYIEEQVARPFSAGTTSDLVSMMSGNGGTQVDVVLYLIGHGRMFSLKATKYSTDPILLQRSSQQTSTSSSAYHRSPTLYP